MNNNPLISVINNAKRRRFIKRGLALLCALVLVFTMNTLKRDANTLERIPMCGYAGEHVHTPDCYDGDTLVCGLAEHIHTDACYQEGPNSVDDMDVQLADAPVVDPDMEDVDLSLSLSEDDFALVSEEVAPAQVASNDAGRQPKAFILGEGAMVSQIIDALGLGVGLDGIIEAAVVENDPAQVNVIGIEKIGSDYRIWALQDFAWAQLALVVEGDILLVDLLDGVAVREEIEDRAAEEAEPAREDIRPAVEESPVDEAVEAQPEMDEQSEVGIQLEDEAPAEAEALVEDAGAPVGDDQGEEAPAPSGDAEPADVEAAEPAGSEEAVEEEAAPAEGVDAVEEEAAPAEGEDEAEEETAPAGGEEAAEEEAAPAEGEEADEEKATPAGGEEAAEEEAAPAEGEEAVEEEAEPAETERPEGEEPTEVEEQPAGDEAEIDGDPVDMEEAVEAPDESDESGESGEAPAGEPADGGQAAYVATIDLAGVSDYPLSLNALLAEAVPAADGEAEAAPVAEGEAEAVPGEEDAGEAGEEAPAEAPIIEYDRELLDIEASGDDHLITPVASFESTVITVDNGSRYALTLVNFALPEAADEAEDEAGPEYPAQDFEGHTRYVKVVVSAPEGAFPAGTTMAVADVEDEKTLTDIEDTVSEAFVEVKRVHAVDITFTDAEGNEIEPLAPISVVMTVDEIEQQQEAVVVHVDDDGATEVVQSQSEAPEGETGVKVEMPAGEAPAGDESAVGFEADSFSVYAVVITETIDTKYIDAEGATWNISVGYGPEAGIPEGARLAVQEVEGDYLEQTAELLRGRETITLARFFDITILDAEGNEVQPARPVEVKATLAEQSEDAVKAVHFAEEGPEIIEASQEAEAVSFDAASFSVYGIVYTVDFHYTANGQTFDYGIPGGDCANLRALLPALDVVSDDPETEEDELETFMAAIADVTFSSPELVRVCPVEADTTVGALREAQGIESEYSAALTEADRAEIDARALTAPDWALFSLAPFTTDETLTVAMENGDSFTIAVTDAQIATRVLASDGRTYKITLTFGPEAEIPLDAQLNAREIKKGTIEWDAYNNQSKIAMGMDLESTLGFARFFDIEIQVNGEKIEPKAPVHVDIALVDTPEDTDNQMKVVHFVGNGAEDEAPEIDGAAGDEVALPHADEKVTTEIPEVIDDVQVEKDSEGSDGATVVRFEADSFSTWGVITTPTTTRFTGNVSDLVGKGFIIKNNNRYFTNIVIGDNPSLLNPTSEKSEASIWYIRPVTNGNYVLYTYDSSGTELQLKLEKRNDYAAQVKLVESDGNHISINRDGDTYTFLVWINKDDRFFLDHWGTNEGLAAYRDQNSPNYKEKFILETSDTYPQPKTSDQGDPDQHFVVLKKNDRYYLVKNDGSLEEVTLGSDGKFFVKDEPMMWSIKTEEDGNQYIEHKSYAKTVHGELKFPTDWYYSYISPMEDNGFADPIVLTPYDPDTPYVPDQYNGEAEFNQKLAENTVVNNQKKSNSRIILEQSGDGTYRIKSAVNGAYYIGISDDGTHVKGQTSFSDSAEVIFGDLDSIYRYGGDALERARRNVVDHIDIGIEASAQLSIPLAPQTYYTVDGPVTLDKVEMVTVTEPVDIGTEDIKQAKLTAYKEGANGQKIERDDVYYITGYSGNAKTGRSAAQVRIEGQFKVAADIPDYDANNPACNLDGESNTNEYDGSAYYRNLRLNNRVWYNIVVEKEVTFHLKKDGKQLYDANHKELTYTTTVALSTSFNYWSLENECPGLYVGRVINRDPNTGEITSQYHPGWLGDDGQPRGVIPHDAFGSSGLDFVLKSDNDQNAVVVCKIIEDENGHLISMKTGTASKVQILQRNNSNADAVANRYLPATKDQNGMSINADPYDGSYRVYGGKSSSDGSQTVSDNGQRTINVSTDGFGVIYDYDIPDGMVGVREVNDSYPQEVTDRNDVEWEYVRTYIETEYVSRRADKSDSSWVHVTRDYTGADDRLSVPEVLGVYTLGNGATENSRFVEFYVHNVYRQKKIEVNVEKDWQQNGNPGYRPPAGSAVDVYLGRYKLVPDDGFDYNDTRVKAKVGIYRDNYGDNSCWYWNDQDFYAGDQLTITFNRQYNQPVKVYVNGGLAGDWDGNESYPNNGTGISPKSIDVTVPEDGVVKITVDDFWPTLNGPGRIEVKKDGTSYGSISGGDTPDPDAGNKNLKYVVDSWKSDAITLDANSSWKGKLENLPAYDENSRLYKYFIIEEVPNDKVPAGTMRIIGTDSEGAVLTSIGGPDPLTLTNIVPNFTITIQKTDSSHQPVPGAEFELSKFNRGAWATVESGITLNETSATATINSLFAGWYRLTETKAPTNHVVRNKEVFFIIATDGNAYLTKQNGQSIQTGEQIYNNLIDIGNRNMFDVVNEHGGGLRINKTLMSGSEGAEENFTFTVTLEDTEGHPYEGYVSLTDRDHPTVTIVPVTGGSLQVSVTGAGSATVDGLPVGTKYTVTEAEKTGWKMTGEVYHNEAKTITASAVDEVDITNAKLGALKLTKVVKLGNVDLSGDGVQAGDKTLADGKYMFSIAGPDPSTDVVKYVQITVTNGTAVSYMIADTTDDITNNVSTVTSGTGPWALIDNLVPGTYTVKETNKNGLELTSVTVGTTTTEKPEGDSVQVTVTAGDTTAAQAGSAATFNNTTYKVDINVLKVDATNTSKTLKDAEFQILKYKDESAGYVAYDFQNKDFVATVSGDASTQNAGDSSKRKTDDDGTLSFTGLLAGQYKLVETKTPDGYIKVENNDIYFTVSADGAVTWTKADGTEITETTETGKLSQVGYTSTNNTFTVGNNPGAKLPSTGGSGTTPYYVFGSLLALVAVALLVARRRGRA